MTTIIDGPASPLFTPLPFSGSEQFEDLASLKGLSREIVETAQHAPHGHSVSWGIPFEIGAPAVLVERPIEISLPPTQAPWLVFLHTSDLRPLEANPSGFYSSSPGRGRLNEHAATYTICYKDGSEAQAEIRRRHQVGMFQRGWGENCFQAVEQHKPFPVRQPHEQLRSGWGWTQTRVAGWEYGPWINWL